MFVLSLVFGVTDVAGCDGYIGITIGCGTSSHIANTLIVSSTFVVFASNVPFTQIVLYAVTTPLIIT